MKRAALFLGLATILLGCDKGEMNCYHCAICGEDLCETMNVIDDFNREQQKKGKELLKNGTWIHGELEAAIKSWWEKNKDKYKVPKGKYDFELFYSPEIYWNEGRAYMLCYEHSRDTYKCHQKEAATDANELKCQVCGKSISVDVRNGKHARLELVPGHWYPSCSACYSRLHKGD